MLQKEVQYVFISVLNKEEAVMGQYHTCHKHETSVKRAQTDLILSTDLVICHDEGCLRMVLASIFQL